MLQEFKKHLDTNFSFLKNSNILVAISGGVDSVVLTELLVQLAYNISLAHCNFKLRDTDSDNDELFVKKLGERLNLKTITTHFETKKYAKEHKLSIQIAARELRYNWFDELISNHNFDYLVTAHHVDDSIETFLINFTRGTGLEGLTGIPQQNGNIIRPLLTFSRNEILDFAEKNNIKWREDKSNSETKYIRNKIRHEVIPILKEINPSLLSSFKKTTHNIQQSQDIINQLVSNELSKIQTKNGDIIKFDIEKIKQLNNPKAFLYQFFKKYGFTDSDDIYNLLNAQSGKQIFSKTHRILKDRDFLLFLPTDKVVSRTQVFYLNKSIEAIEKPISLTFKQVKNKSLKDEKNIVFFDTDKLIYPLVIRKWRNGDYFYPIGMKGKKKLSKFFKDEKMSLFDKEKVWLLCNANNDVLWIIDKRQDRRFAVTNKTNQITKIKLTYHPQ